MMSIIKLKHVIPKLIASFPLEKYLLDSGYVFKRNLKLKNLPTYKGYIKFREDKSTQDLVFIAVKDDHYIYYDFSKNDTGNSIHFIKNRIDNVDEINDKNSLITACKNMLIYMSENGYYLEEVQEHKKQTNANEFNQFLKTSFSSYFDLNFLEDKEYFTMLGIDDDVLENDLFKNTVFNSKGLVLNNINKRTKENLKNIVNISFLMYDENDNECGIAYSNFLYGSEANLNEELNIYAPFSKVDRGLWFSNKILHGKGSYRQPAYLVNHPAEAIAHFNINRDLKSYISFFEKITSENLKHIKKYILENDIQIILATPNKKESIVDDLKIYTAFLEEQSFKFLKFENNTVEILFNQNKADKESVIELLRRIKKFNQSYVLNTIKVLGESSKQYIKDDIIKIEKLNTTDIVIKIPYTFSHLSNFLTQLYRSFPLKEIIGIEKSEAIHWRLAERENSKIKNSKLQYIKLN